MTLLKKHRVGIRFEFAVWCMHSFLELDGYYCFAKEEIPQPGDGMVLCDGCLFRVTRVFGFDIYTEYADEKAGYGCGY